VRVFHRINPESLDDKEWGQRVNESLCVIEAVAETIISKFNHQK